MSNRKRRKNKHNMIAAFFLLPLAIFYGVFYLYSFYYLISTSFLRTDISLRNPVFIGLQNYVLLFTHDQFYRSIFNTLLFAGVAILVGLTLGFFSGGCAFSENARQSLFLCGVFAALFDADGSGCFCVWGDA